MRVPGLQAAERDVGSRGKARLPKDIEEAQHRGEDEAPKKGGHPETSSADCNQSEC